jgi:hypothetical protein
MNGPNKLKLAEVEWIVSDKHSSLLFPFQTNEENEVFGLRTKLARLPIEIFKSFLLMVLTFAAKKD